MKCKTCTDEKNQIKAGKQGQNVRSTNAKSTMFRKVKSEYISEEIKK